MLETSPELHITHKRDFMKQKPGKSVVCPNCFGTGVREVLGTATSRNIVHDDSAPPSLHNGKAAADKRKELVKLFCIHCGHELTPKGGRA